MERKFVKSKTKLLVLLMVVAVVALSVTLALTAFGSAKAESVSDPFELANKLSDSSSGTILELTRDIELDNPITISRTGSVTLDLHGYALTYRGESASPVITVSSGSFILTDSANPEATSHTVTYRGDSIQINGGVVTGGRDGGILVTGGSFTFAGGTIAGNSSSGANRGGGVTYAATASTFTMKDGATISYNSAMLGGGVHVLSLGSTKMDMQGGEITNNTAAVHGGGVYLTGSQGILLEMKKGSISNNTAQSGNGGGIYVDKTITAIVSGGTVSLDAENITRISSNTALNGAGVYVDGGIFQMSGGSLTVNNSSQNGAGIYAKDASVTVSGGEIASNKATYGNGAGVYMTNSTLDLSNAQIRSNQISSYGNGAGVYVEGSSSVLTMTSGSITSNTVTGTGTGAGVYFTAGTLNMSGSPVIADNIIAGKANNLYLVGSQTVVNITGEISDSASVGVTVDSARTFTKGYTTSGNTTVKGFLSDTTGWTTVLVNKELIFTQRLVAMVTNNSTHESTPYATVEQAFNAVNQLPTGNFSIQLQADVETTATLTVSVRNLTLDLNGYMIRNTTTTVDVITVTPTSVAATVNFTLMDSRPEAGPHEIAVASHLYETNPAVSPIVKIYGGVITGGRHGIAINTPSESYGCNLDFNSGTIASTDRVGINGEEQINDNGHKTITLRSGAAVRYCGYRGIGARRAQLNIDGGDISYNYLYGIMAWGTVCTMTDGRVTNNGANGFWVSTYSTLYLEGGDVSYNGYGVGGDIDNNTRYTDGARAGIGLMYLGDKLVMSGGTVSHNAWEGIVTQATQVDVTTTDAYMVTITGGEISYNGHEGVRLTNSWLNSNANLGTSATDATTTANAYIANATISYNGGHAIMCSNGGRLDAIDTTMVGNMTDGSIKLNHSNYAGHLYAGGTVNLTNCKIDGRVNGNRKDIGLIAWDFVATVTVRDCEIYGCDSGIEVYNANSTITFESGEISDCNYGLYALRGKFVMNGGSIHHNGYTKQPSGRAPMYGAGIMTDVYGGISTSIELNGGEIHDNKAVRGGGIYIGDRSYEETAKTGGTITVTMKEGFKIYNNTATESGGAVYISAYRSSAVDTYSSQHTFNMQGGEIYGNSAMYGGGVYVDSTTSAGSYSKLSSIFKMSGGEIRDNEATAAGGGIYLGSHNTTVEMKGQPYVYGNTDMSGKASNLYIAGDQKITVTGTIDHDTTDVNNADTYKVGISLESVYYGKILTTNYNKNNNRNTSVKGFVLDDPSLGTIATSSDELILDTNGVVAVGKWNEEATGSDRFTMLKKYGTWTEAYTDITKGTTANADAIQLLADVGVQAMINVTKTMTLDLNGYMIMSSTGDYLDTLVQVATANVKLTITDSTYVDGVSTAEVTHWFANPVTEVLNKEKISIPGYTTPSSVWDELRGGVIHGRIVINGGSVDFLAGNLVNGRSVNTKDHNELQYGIYVTGTGSKLYIGSDATFCYNRDTSVWHAGINSTTTVDGATFRYNASVYGAALLAVTPGITIKEGTDIYHNANWGIVHEGSNFGGGTIDMFTVKISSTTYYGTINMEGGSVHDNIAVSSGGNSVRGAGVVINGGGVFTMGGGSIVNNHVINADGLGVNLSAGGIYVSGGQQGKSPIVFTGGYVIIEGNTLEGVESNIGFASDKDKISVTNALERGSRIGVSLLRNALNYIFTDGYSRAGLDETNIPFFADDPTNCLIFDNSVGGSGELILNKHDVNNAEHFHHYDMVLANCKTGEMGKPQRWYCDVCDRWFVSVEPFVEYVDERDDIQPEHEFNEYSYYSPTQHRAQCTVCDEYILLDHITTDWIASGNGQHTSTCTVCKSEVTQNCEYQGAENRKSNATQHYQQCPTCGAQYDHEEHKVAEGTQWRRVNATSHQAECATCAYTVVAAHTTEGVAWTYDKKNLDSPDAKGNHEHYQICPDCNTEINTREHELEVEVDEDGNTTSRCATCGYESTTAHHRKGDTLQHDEFGHWYECEEAGHENEKLNYSEHKLTFDTSRSGQHTVSCEDCTYSVTESCTFTGWTWNEEDPSAGHFRACTICKQKDGGQGNEVQEHGSSIRYDGTNHWWVCETCGYVVKEAEAHTWEWRADAEQHYQICTVCEEEGHRVRNAETIGYHDFVGAPWVTDGDQHWQICTNPNCDTESARVAHDKFEVSDGVDGHHYECRECDWASDTVEHDWENEYRKNSEGHFYRCKVCGYTQNAVAHYYEGEYTYVGGNQHSINCKDCGYTFTENCVNRYDITATTHASVCEKCGHTQEAVAHNWTYTSNQSEHWRVCPDCSYVEEARGEHTWNTDGKCEICGRDSNDPLQGERVKANADLEAAAEAAKAKLQGDDDTKERYARIIDNLLLNAELDIDTAADAREIAAIVDAALNAFEEQVTKNAKEVAHTELEAKANEVLERVYGDETLSEEAIARFENAIYTALDSANRSVENANSAEAVAAALEQGKLDIEKAYAKQQLREKAEQKKKEVQDRVDRGELTPEQGEQLQDVIDRETQRGEGKIDDATDVDGIGDEVERAEGIIDNTAQSSDPDLEEKKADARDELDQKAQDAKDKVDGRDDLTPSQKEELKKDIDKDNKAAQDEVNAATTPEEVDQAVQKGKDNMDKTADSTPNKGSGLLSWFKNNALPLGYAGIALGAMLLLIFILAIAARKPKNKQ